MLDAKEKNKPLMVVQQAIQLDKSRILSMDFSTIKRRCSQTVTGRM